MTTNLLTPTRFGRTQRFNVYWEGRKGREGSQGQELPLAGERRRKREPKKEEEKIMKSHTASPQTRADRAQTHGPPHSVQISFLLYNACRTYHSWPTAVPGLWTVSDMFVLVCSVRLSVNYILNGWPHDHGPTNVRAKVKKIL